jgi:hypothetical protein
MPTINDSKMTTDYQVRKSGSITDIAGRYQANQQRKGHEN